MNTPDCTHTASNLLAGKGEAAPWPMLGAELASPNLKRAPDVEIVADETRSSVSDDKSCDGTHDASAAQPTQKGEHDEHRAQPRPGAKRHSKCCTLRLTPNEYQRLAILGVKRDMTRQQLLRQAIDHYLAARPD